MSILKFLFPNTKQNPKTSVAFLSSWQERGTGNVKDLNSFIVRILFWIVVLPGLQ